MSGVLGILSEEEAKDVSSLDLEELMRRFHNLNGTKFTPESLSTYKSRVKSSIEDFLRYRENPLAFRASVPTGGRPSRKVNGGPQGGEDKQVQVQPKFDTTARPSPVDNIVPIQIRADLTIYIQGLPFDLAPLEARKIANVVLAMALPSE